jgi:uncharacterized membrane protein YphA (DoxX/SURF4 family)
VSQSRPRPARPSQRGSRGPRSAPGRPQPSSHTAATAAPASAPVPASARDLPRQAGALAAEWAPLAARVLLGLVLGWFGYHELVQPMLWTGYVPGLSPGSSVAVLAVLAHGWVLLMLAAALIAGIATRLAAGIAAITLVEIVVSLAVTAGLSDLVLRDVGVLGLAICLTGVTQQRLVLHR